MELRSWQSWRTRDLDSAAVSQRWRKSFLPTLHHKKGCECRTLRLGPDGFYPIPLKREAGSLFSSLQKGSVQMGRLRCTLTTNENCLFVLPFRSSHGDKGFRSRNGGEIFRESRYSWIGGCRVSCWSMVSGVSAYPTKSKPCPSA